MIKQFIIVTACFLMSSLAYAQTGTSGKSTSTKSMPVADDTDIESDTTSTAPAKKQKPKVNIIWMPVLASSPANGFMFGVAPAANWIMGDPKNTSISSTLASFVYTTKKQFLFTCKSTVFSNHNKHVMMQDWRYFITSQPTFGLGTGPQSSKLVNNGIEYEDGLFSKGIKDPQLIKFNFLRLYQTFFNRIKTSNMFYGLGYHLDYHYKIKDELLNIDTVPPVITSHYAFSKEHNINPEKYTTSGISANFLFDARDNSINPYKGAYFLGTIRYNPTWLGSTKNSSLLWLEYRNYFNVNKLRPRNVIGLWMYTNIQLSGTLPYLDLPASGWDQFGRSARGYPQGRFRGQSLAYSEVEWRFPLQRDKDKWGAVLFANATTASNRDVKTNLFSYINTGVGFGLRYMINEKSRTNLCLDYAFGNYGAQGFYLSVNEVF